MTDISSRDRCEPPDAAQAPQLDLSESVRPPVTAAWGAGRNSTAMLIEWIRRDCSPQYNRRYAEREGYNDPRYLYRYPLREWGWTLEDCIAGILATSLLVPPKSSCYGCTATKPQEIRAYSKTQLRRLYHRLSSGVSSTSQSVNPSHPNWSPS
jgi:hypothetical protein